MTDVLTKKAHKMFLARECFICHEHIPPTKGVYHTGLRILICQGHCNEVVDHFASQYKKTGERLRVLEALDKFSQIEIKEAN